MILDLRNNPGGLLASVIEIADQFLEEGVIVSIKGRDPSQNQTFRAQDKVLVPDIPLIVLVNGGSASASEILAGAIKDNQRGVIVGEKTFGKGSVQTVRELPDGSGIRITTAVYYTPSGKSINDIGIERDEVVKAVELSNNELQQIDKLEELGLIEDFAQQHRRYTEKQFNELMGALKEEGLELRPIVVRRLIKNELEKNQLPSLIDLDYDLQLKHAVKMLKSGDLMLKEKAS